MSGSDGTGFIPKAKSELRAVKSLSFSGIGTFILGKLQLLGRIQDYCSIFSYGFGLI
ncbi:MAG: hypothetical protein JRI61_04100 [Deltaproteobacteria bacterium]|nr:hypothetical protein [Deltaproteobacteria bacterium]